MPAKAKSVLLLPSYVKVHLRLRKQACIIKLKCSAFNKI